MIKSSFSCVNLFVGFSVEKFSPDINRDNERETSSIIENWFYQNLVLSIRLSGRRVKPKAPYAWK